MDKDLLYKKTITKGGRVRYIPYGRIFSRDDLPLGDWIIQVRKGCTSIRPASLDPETKGGVDSLLLSLKDEIAKRLVEACKPTLSNMTEKDERILKEALRKMDSKSQCLYYNSVNDIVDSALEVVMEKYLSKDENNPGE